MSRNAVLALASVTLGFAISACGVETEEPGPSTGATEAAAAQEQDQTGDALEVRGGGGDWRWETKGWPWERRDWSWETKGWPWERHGHGCDSCKDDKKDHCDSCKKDPCDSCKDDKKDYGKDKCDHGC